MLWTDIVSALAATLAALTSVVAAITALSKYFQSKKSDFESTRPFVIPEFQIIENVNERRLYLVLRNVGDTPARNVRLQFTSGGAWNWVSNPSYPFLSPSGISAIGPGDSVRYFLGVMRGANPISDIEFRDIEGFVTFMNPIGGKDLIDEFRISLSDNRYKSR